MIYARYDYCMPDYVLGYLLKQVHRRMVAIADAALESLRIDRNEFGVLRLLADGEPLSQQALATKAGVDPTTMVALIDALEGKGIVVRKPDPTDRRRNSIELTDTGRATWKNARAAYIAAEAEFLEPLSADQAAQFRDALQVLADAGRAG